MLCCWISFVLGWYEFWMIIHWFIYFSRTEKKNCGVAHSSYWIINYQYGQFRGAQGSYKKESHRKYWWGKLSFCQLAKPLRHVRRGRYLSNPTRPHDKQEVRWFFDKEVKIVHIISYTLQLVLYNNFIYFTLPTEGLTTKACRFE